MNREMRHYHLSRQNPEVKVKSDPTEAGQSLATYHLLF